MAQDQRDYVVEQIKAKTDYVEKARFRQNLGEEYQRYVSSKRGNGQLHVVWKVLIAAVLFALILIITKLSY